MATTAQFSEVPFTNTIISGSTAANTGRTGAGTIGTNIFTLCTAGANGGRVDKISYVACGTLVANTAGMIRIFLSSDRGPLLWRELVVAATTPSASAVGANNFSSRLIDSGLILKAGQSVYCTSHFSDLAGNQFAVTIEGGNF